MKTMIKTLACGGFGDGKTFHAGTYPKSYWISTEPAGFETIEINPHLLKNVVKQDYFIPSPLESVGDVFKRMAVSCKEAYQLCKEGKVDTLVLDNLTYTMENRWIYINEFQKMFTKNGELDVRSMYGILSRWAYEFILINFCSFPGNVVVTAHIMQEHEEAMKKKIGTDDIVPNILGGFRNQAGGMFSLYMFLEKLKTQQGYKFMARVDASNQKKAKNRYNLPEVIENVSYNTILTAIKKAKGEN